MRPKSLASGSCSLSLALFFAAWGSRAPAICNLGPLICEDSPQPHEEFLNHGDIARLREEALFQKNGKGLTEHWTNQSRGVR